MKVPFDNIKRGSLYEEVAEILKEAILTRQYRQGEPLPSEMELSKQFGVSRNVVREAIRLLQSRGFLEIRRGKSGGAYIAEFKPTTISENLSDLIRIGYVTVGHLTNARTFLEPEILRLAAQNATREDLQDLEALIDEYDRTSDDDTRRKLNCAFHRRIGEACGNPLFSILMDSIMDFTERFIQTMNPTLNIVHRQGEHREIFDAIKAHDPEKASVLAKRHWAHLSEEVERFEEAYTQIMKDSKASEQMPATAKQV